MAFLATTTGSYLPPSTVTTVLREDLIEIAYIIDPYETSLMTIVDRVDVDSPVVQWITDSLPTLTATTSGSIDVQGINYMGLSESITPDFATNYPYTAQPSRQTSVIQLFGAKIATTDILNRARVSGIKNPYQHELVKATKSVAKAIERRAVDNSQATGANYITYSTGDPRAMRSMFEYRSGGAGAVAPFLNQVTVNGLITTDAVDQGMEAAVTSGGMPEYLFVSIGSKLDFSVDARTKTPTGYSSINQSFINAQERRIIRQVDFYQGEFGPLAVVMNYQIPQSNSTTGGGKAWLIQRNMHAWGTYAPVEHIPLAKTGTQTSGMLFGAGVWIVRNAGANTVINGVTT